ncbi:cystathionine gamma-synthase [Calidifontibacter sp. DB0510]|uniref:homocysteine desulfhydrase n=1 Tax=Metallococcus carri TaxID=1656884 RepID=A0A967B4I2_9MICO|nr:PLP-dependent transferase [Metallococcus carri]NHN54476.1 cystathionine gamma-synthase [Metallococcus carri]NOP36685.1 cystathionine gamma-synthase [Calidifontibacter sp. DB2511S]
MSHEFSPATRVVAAGRPPRVPGAPVGPAVTFTSTYVAGEAPAYGRFGNPTWTELEDALGELEGGRALSFASGMAAIAAALSLTPERATVVAPQHCYNGTGALLSQYAEQRGWQVRRAPIEDTSAYVQAMAGADVVWLESPTNPMLEIADLRALCDAARAHGAISVCDNTFATPLDQRPLESGADLVMHSVTKYLAGHSDLVLGAVVVGDDALHERLLAHRTLHGGIPGPMEAWLALRGLRTLHVRWDRACDNARVLAQRLATHPAVSRVRYPDRGAMIAIELGGDQAAAEALERAVEVWLPSTSLGGVESMLERRRRHPTEPPTVPADLVRLSVGIEDVEDLWRDLDAALRRSRACAPAT